MADFDAEMQQALELSAQQHMATCTTLVMDGQQQSARRDLDAPCSQHWKPPCRPRDGILMQVDTVNQFAQHWAPLIREHNAPSATCGYMVMANTLALQKCLPVGGVWNQQQLSDLLRVLRDPKFLEPSIREAMEIVSKSRTAWMARHAPHFSSEASRRNYLSAWVANYELSDFMRLKSEEGRFDRAPVHFVRYNQWPQYGAATHEERDRLLEEKRFGGTMEPSGRTTYAPEDCTFLVESFRGAERLLQGPEEFLQSCDAKTPAAPCVFAIDLNGHFVTAVAIHLETADEGTKPALVVINTTGVRYLDNPACAFTFDLMNAPEPSEGMAAEGFQHSLHEHPLMDKVSTSAMCDICEAVGTAYRCAAGCDWDICKRCFQQSPKPVTASPAAASLEAMGFPASRVQEALAAAGGDKEKALEMLLG